MPAGARHGETGRRAGVDDRAAFAALHHQAHPVFAGEIDPAQVDVVRSLPDVDVQLVHRRIFADELNGGAGVEHVEAPMAAAHLVECGGDARLVRDIRDQRERLAADLLDRRLDRRRVAVEQTDDRPFASKCAGGFLTDPAPAPVTTAILPSRRPTASLPESVSASAGCYRFARTP